MQVRGKRGYIMSEHLNCSCGQKLGRDTDRPWPESKLCPTCGEYFDMKARDMWGTSYCKNNHVWHTCVECKVIVVGESPKELYYRPEPKPLCQSCEDLKERVSYLEKQLKEYEARFPKDYYG